MSFAGVKRGTNGVFRSDRLVKETVGASMSTVKIAVGAWGRHRIMIRPR